MRLRRLALAPLVCAVAACSDAPSAPADASGLVGIWAEPRMAHQPNGSIVRRLVLTSGGRFRLDLDLYGIYPGQAATTRSAWTRTEGTYQVNGDRIVFAPAKLTVWDSFYKGRGPEVYAPYPYGGVFDDCRFRIVGDALVLDFTTYPADAPIPATTTFVRWTPGTSG